MRLGKLEWSEWQEALSRDLCLGPLCLVYQMPDATSLAIESALQQALPDHRIHRLPFMSENSVSCFRRMAALPGVTEAIRESFHSQCSLGRRLRGALTIRKRLKRFIRRIPKIKVIASVREPVGLLLSALFDLHAVYFPQGARMDTLSCARLILGDASIDSTRQQAVASMHQFIQKWFDWELRRIFEVDVYQQPFPHSQGYAIFETEFARILVHRFENAESLNGALENFLGRRVPQVFNPNPLEKKEYAAQYRLAQRELRLPLSFLSEEYGDKLARHFYTREEREKWMEHWRGEEAPVPSASPPAIWVDVGAHLGESSLAYARAHPETRVYAFEPNLRLAAEQFNRLPNYIVIPMAVAETNGFADFLINDNTAVSSLLPFDAEALSRWVGGEQILRSNKVLVPSIRLDTFMEAVGLKEIDYLKVDAQGADFSVIRSAGEHVQKIKKIKLEVTITPTQLYAGAATKKEIIEYLLCRGFALAEIEAQTHGQEENLTFVRVKP
jgi:FkbM family methyltransferase